MFLKQNKISNAKSSFNTGKFACTLMYCANQRKKGKEDRRTDMRKSRIKKTNNTIFD